MKVLFISIPFREYVTEIRNAIINELNADVDIIYCDLKPPLFFRILNKIFCGMGERWYNKVKQKKAFKKYESKKYDYIFVLVGRNVEVDELKRFCRNQYAAKKILYLWDDVARVNSFAYIKNIFNEIYSFDDKDCKKYGFRFLPLFFCNQYVYSGDKKNIDYSCIGGLHSARERYIKFFVDFCTKHDLINYFHLQTTRFNILKEFLLFNRSKLPTFIKFNELSMQESSEIVKHSICVVDMPHSSQSGLTIRTIEALAAKTKLITTNKAIKDYDFYNENNILITDENCSNLTEEFVRTPYVKIDDKIIEKYSLNSWVKNIFLGD